MPGGSKRPRKSKRALELEAMEAERDAYQENDPEALKNYRVSCESFHGLAEEVIRRISRGTPQRKPHPCLRTVREGDRGCPQLHLVDGALDSVA